MKNYVLINRAWPSSLDNGFDFLWKSADCCLEKSTQALLIKSRSAARESDNLQKNYQIFRSRREESCLLLFGYSLLQIYRPISILLGIALGKNCFAIFWVGDVKPVAGFLRI